MVSLKKISNHELLNNKTFWNYFLFKEKEALLASAVGGVGEGSHEQGHVKVLGHLIGSHGEDQFGFWKENAFVGIVLVDEERQLVQNVLAGVDFLKLFGGNDWRICAAVRVCSSKTNHN